jgi:hypothetical protein
MSRARFGLLLALLAVVVAAGAFAVGVALLDDNGPDTPPGDTDEVIVRDVGEAADGTDGPAESTTTTAPPPDGPTWIAVVSSGASEDEARNHAETAAAASGLATGVLRSDDHESLNPGLWVAYAGPFATPAEAEAAVSTLDEAGIGGTYARCVGTDDQCG